MGVDLALQISLGIIMAGDPKSTSNLTVTLLKIAAGTGIDPEYVSDGVSFPV
jgi:hypothetical protein